MPIVCHHRPDERLVIFVHSGLVSDDEFLSFYGDFYADPAYDKTHDILVDLREAESHARSSAALQKFVAIAREYTPEVSPRPKIAVVAPAAVSFGLARMYEAFSGFVPADFTVFKAANAALAWLGASEGALDEL